MKRGVAEEGSSYGVAAPDLPGCFSGGDTLEEALEEAFDNAREAIVGHVETLLMDNQPIPKVLLLDVHQSNDDYRDGLWGFLDVDLTAIPYKSVCRGTDPNTRAGPTPVMGRRSQCKCHNPRPRACPHR